MGAAFTVFPKSWVQHAARIANADEYVSSQIPANIVFLGGYFVLRRLTARLQLLAPATAFPRQMRTRNGLRKRRLFPGGHYIVRAVPERGTGGQWRSVAGGAGNWGCPQLLSVGPGKQRPVSPSQRPRRHTSTGIVRTLFPLVQRAENLSSARVQNQCGECNREPSRHVRVKRDSPRPKITRETD
jgi:hypothetical protein